jgi:hypothetical protein
VLAHSARSTSALSHSPTHGVRSLAHGAQLDRSEPSALPRSPTALLRSPTLGASPLAHGARPLDLRAPPLAHGVLP